MHSLLENYLAEVSVQLGSLLAKQRDEEMREMRQRLLSAMEANRDLGQTEDEAAANALAEFGTSEKASESILWACRRDLRKKMRKQSGQSCLKSVGVWTAFYVFEGFRSPHEASRWCCAWIATMFISALIIVVPYYSLEKFHSPLMRGRTKYEPRSVTAFQSFS